MRPGRRVAFRNGYGAFALVYLPLPLPRVVVAMLARSTGIAVANLARTAAVPSVRIYVLCGMCARAKLLNLSVS